MNTKTGVIAAIVIALTVSIPAGNTQDTDEPPEELQKLWDMSPDERQATLKEMSEEERNTLKEAARAHRARQRAERAEMTPEVRAAYEAPFAGPEYEAGARQFPSLVPIFPDDVEIPANKKAATIISS